MNTFFRGPFENGLFTDKQWKKKRALIIVPHQDDEINLAGATIRNLVNHGIMVYVLFCITCDLLEPPQVRVAEGIRSCQILGVPDKNILFLGYCNNPTVNGTLAFYNAADDTVITSSRNMRETYGMPDKPEWCWLRHKTHHAFTRGNFRDDIADVLLTIKPDLVFAVDFDRHPDHRAVSLLFDEAVGNILKRPENDYFPEIYKGFAYNGSYLGARDFYSSLNLKGEVKAEGNFSNDPAFDTDFPPYTWNERIRLPLPRETLSRTLNGNFLYNAIRAHFSQGMLHNAKRIFNSDQVFWRRRTDSICYNAQITVSSGNASFLNDFKLADCPDILHLPAEFSSGTWSPDSSDLRKQVSITFKKPVAIQRITLFGNAEKDHRVLKGKIILSNGSTKFFGPLAEGAKPNHIDFEKPETINGLTICLTETEGKQAGLTEIQVYKTKFPKTILKIVKLMIKDTFAYDYRIREPKNIPLQIYCYDEKGARVFENQLPPGYRLKCINTDTYMIKGLTLIPGPKFKEAVLRIESETDPCLFDQIVIRKITLPEYLHLKILQGIDVAANRMEHVIKNKYYKWFQKERRTL